MLRPRVIDIAAAPQHEAGRRIDADFSAPKVAFFAHFSQRPEVSRSVQTLVEQLSGRDYHVILASAAPFSEPLRWPTGLPDGVTVYRRPNIGYDFGSWASLLQRHPAAAAAGHVLLVNDSMVGPFRPLDDVFDHFETCSTDVWGLVDSTQDAPHLQSHWVGYRNGVLSHPPLRRFWRSIRVQPSKKKIVRRYEIGQSHLIMRRGYTVSVMYPYTLVTRRGGNPTSGGWRRLLAYDFPFVKKEIVERPPPEVPDAWAVDEVVAERFGEDVRSWL